MIVPVLTEPPAAIDYPDDDGKPMSDNTLQFQWIVTLQGGLDDLFRDNPDVFVGGNLLWYAVEGKNKVRTTPDAMVVFGRPKGYRGSYRQWVENGVGPQVVFEVLSPGNRPAGMAKKLLFYEKFGVEEYYIYDPDNVVMSGYTRDRAGKFQAIPDLNGYASPRLDIRFDMSGEELVVVRPDGRCFMTYLEQSQRATHEAERATQEAQRATQEAHRAERAEKELVTLRAKLREAGIKLD